LLATTSDLTRSARRVINEINDNINDNINDTSEEEDEAADRASHTFAPRALTFRPSAAFRPARWTALIPPAAVSHDRGDIPAALANRWAADGRTITASTR
jgi:hypothetical protein